MHDYARRCFLPTVATVVWSVPPRVPTGDDSGGGGDMDVDGDGDGVEPDAELEGDESDAEGDELDAAVDDDAIEPEGVLEGGGDGHSFGRSRVSYVLGGITDDEVTLDQYLAGK